MAPTIPIRSLAACGLSQSEFLRQLCRGRKPKTKPTEEFWKLMDALYDVHSGFQKCVKYEPSAAEICAEIERLVLELQEGKPTRYNVYREDVKEAINFSRRPYYMEDYLRRKGYITDFTGAHWKIRLPQYEHFTRLDTLDERWTPENIQRTMGRYTSFGNRRANSPRRRSEYLPGIIFDLSH